MSLEEFKLSSTLYGHSSDVRYININDENCIISASRDKTCKFWKPNGINPGFSEFITFKGHSKFVSSVCSLPATPEYPNGLVISGGNDNNICVFSPDHQNPIVTFAGHSNTVCCISRGNVPNTFITSSWDCTGKLWKICNNTLQELIVFTGHQMSVWAIVQLPNGNVVTGSADKEIIIWSENGHMLKVLRGHTDCVRGLTVLNENTFLSVSNDASIKQWTLDGELLDTFYGHTSFIYSVCPNKALGDDGFVTSGEDRMVKCWQNGENIYTINVPAQSVWSVACLPNGDVVTGSSDGLVRIFTLDSTRVADEHQLKMYDEEVAKLNRAATQEIGGVKITDLPGREVLFEPGKTDGQTKLIREGDSVVCYSWSATEGTWNKVGDVMGAAGGTQATSGKTLYEGKEYDYVFSVDIEDGKPPLKLPYNRDQDPWFTAQEFIHKNNLPQAYLEQVANFIVENSNSAVITQTAPNTDYVDPFTGGNRYLPGSGTTGPSNAGTNLDPFTGASSYTTSNAVQQTTNNLQNMPTNPDPFTSSESHTTKQKEQTSSRYFPHMSYLFFDQGNLTVIHDKLKEFNEKAGDNMCNIDENILDGLVKLANGPQDDIIYLDTLKQLLDWPQDIVFPVLDITRLAVRHFENNTLLCSHSNGIALIKLLRKFITQDIGANKMLALRILCNMFSHPSGETLISTHETVLCADIANLDGNLNKNCQIALSTFLLNLSIQLVKSQNYLRLIYLIELIAKIIILVTDQEAEFRCFVALGTVVDAVNKTSYTRSNKFIPELRDKLIKICSNSNESIQMRNINCARELLNLFI